MKNTRSPSTNYYKNSGFTLIELMSTSAIIGILASIAVPSFLNYTVQAKTTEGLLLIAELRRRVELEFNRTSILPTTIPASPAPTEMKDKGPLWSYEDLFGKPSEMWLKIEYQNKGPNRLIKLKSQRDPEWNNEELRLHLQIRLESNNTLAFRCVGDEKDYRAKFLPASCRDGDKNDWTSW